MPFRIVEISSPKNPLLQDIRQANAHGRPTSDGLLVAEGPHLAEELLTSRWTPQKLIFTPQTFPIWEGHARKAAVESLLIPARVFDSIAGTKTSQGVMALARPHDWEWRDLEGNPTLIVVLDGLQDPGNAGTIIRSAEAFGATGVVLLNNSVRISNGKMMRASAGSIFHLPLCEGFKPEEFLVLSKAANLRLYALDPGGKNSPAAAELAEPCAIIVGSEANGVSGQLRDAARIVALKTHRVESLNAGVACSITLYEAARQRQSHEPI